MGIPSELMNLRISIETVDKVLQYLPDSRNRIKSLPAIFRKPYDENFISDFLAYILDPYLNGAGLDPLKQVVKHFSFSGYKILDNLTIAEKNNIQVLREYTFSGGRRIDILIIIKNHFILAIENKIFSEESDQQTKDYADSIAEAFPDYETLMLFLTLKGKEAQSNQFNPLSYPELVNLLKGVNFDYRDDIRKKILFDEFILHVEEYMMKKQSEAISEQTKLYLEYWDTIQKLTDFFQKDSMMVFQKFEGILNSVFEGEDWIVWVKEGGRTYHQVYKPSWETKGLYIHYEFHLSSNDILTRSHIPIMIEVEGGNKEAFMSAFNEKQGSLAHLYNENGILYRPENRKIAIAYKSLENHFCPGFKGDNLLAEEIQKLRFLDETIDLLLKEYTETIG